MSKEITKELLSNFHKIYQQSKDKTEQEIRNKGLIKALENNEVIKEKTFNFDIELKETKRYDQVDSEKCWIFVSFNFIKYNLATNLNIDINQLTLSSNYISFYDKLEKSNNLYETIINLKKTNYKHLYDEEIFTYCITEGGYFQWFVSIVEKYGLVPYEAMKDSYDSLHSNNFVEFFSNKVKKDCIKLIALKKSRNKKELRKYKQKLLKENYIILAKILGEPPIQFDFKYKDINNKEINLSKITPIEFYHNNVTISLKDYIVVADYPFQDRIYNRAYKMNYIGNVYKKSDIVFLNLPITKIKKYIIEQLKDGIPVIIRLNPYRYRNYDNGILNTNLYKYEQYFKTKPLNRKELLNTNSIYPNHFELLCGVALDKNKPIKWKLEDSFGEKNKTKGYFVMNDEYLDRYVFDVIINKKYLSTTLIDKLQDPIIINDKEPF